MLHLLDVAGLVPIFNLVSISSLFLWMLKRKVIIPSVTFFSYRLLAYIQENENEDPLVNPLAQSDNPFKPKTPCTIL